MKTLRFSTLLVAVTLAVTSLSLLAQQVEVREETLSNGMRLLMVERPGVPTIAAGWVARVGSVDERPGITGMSHLFEHMMFKGSEVIGITDFEAGQALQDRQDAVRKEMEEEYQLLRQKKRRGEITGNIYDPENMTPRLKELREQLTELFDEEKKLIVKDEMSKIYREEGATSLNAFTTQDQTVYIVTIPSNKLELWCWMESDRLMNPVFREFYAERDVVREERRLRIESTPTGKLNEQFNAMFWQSAPYAWPVVGWPSDVESITREQAEAYFSIYYAPNNLTAILVGDFDADEALRMAEAYFGRIPRGERPPPPVITEEIEQEAEKRMVAEADTNTTVNVRFHTAPFNHSDMFALDVLAGLLNGRTGRLYKALVEKEAIAVGEPSAFTNSLQYEGFFQLSAQVKEGKTAEEVEEALLAQLEKIKEETIPDRELQKVKNQVLANSVRRLQSDFFLMIQLAIYDSLGDWRFINQSPEKMLSVSAEDIQEVARRYFTEENRNVAIYLRRESTGELSEEDAILAELPEQARGFVRQQIQAIREIEDASRLEAAIQRVEGQMANVPPNMQRAIEYILQVARERLDELGPGEADEAAEPPQQRHQDKKNRSEGRR